MKRIKAWLEHPLTRGIDIDSPHTTTLRRRIVQEKPFLRQIYKEWYRQAMACVPSGPGQILEIGSGAGFLSESIPGLITSDVLFCPWIKIVLDAHGLPFKSDSLRAIVMINVFHHLSQVRCFLKEAGRCIRPGGVVIMIEPWLSEWSSLIYTHLHHEPFDPGVKPWEFATSGPLSSANGALPWIVFARDRAIFEAEFPIWDIHSIQPTMPFRYLLSGGISMRSLAPTISFGLWRRLEMILLPWMSHLAMFAEVVLVRKS